MARAAGDATAAQSYRVLYAKGSEWIDANLFNGEYYIQNVRGFRADEIAKNLRSDMGSADTENPEYQVGAGCLVDQLLGQYLADAGDLGALVSPDRIRTALGSIYRYNLKRSLVDHDNVARTYALNDEAAVVICDYGKAERPRIPFPYYPESWTGQEYPLASLMMRWGMVDEGVEIVRNARLRFDGEKRNPWDEAECGHHYARAMSAWSTVLAMSGFGYDGPNASVIATPPAIHGEFRCIWATGTGWGTFALRRQQSGATFGLKVLAGSLACRSCEIAAAGTTAKASSSGRTIENRLERRGDRVVVTFGEELRIGAGDEVTVEVSA